MSLFRDFFLGNPNFVSSETPLLSLLYEVNPARSAWLPNLPRITGYEGDPETPSLEFEQDGRDGKPLLGRISWGKHVVSFATAEAPVPDDVLDRTLWPTYWRPDLKELMASHQQHILLRYDGDEPAPLEQYVALYKAASIFPPNGFLGVINEPAWTCHPPEILYNLVEPELLQVVRDSPPWLYWTGFLQMDLADLRWYISRGHHLFGQPDFALLDNGELDPLEAQHRFHELLSYAFFEGVELKAGDVIGIDDDHTFELVALDDALDPLNGVGRTLIVHPLTMEEQDALGEELGLDPLS